MDNKAEYWQITGKLMKKQQQEAVQPKLRSAARQMRAEEFRRVLTSFDAEQKKLDESADKRRKTEAKLRLEKREREKRISEIRALIMHYRRKLSFNKNDKVALAAISELETKLFWLMFSL